MKERKKETLGSALNPSAVSRTWEKPPRPPEGEPSRSDGSESGLLTAGGLLLTLFGPFFGSSLKRRGGYLTAPRPPRIHEQEQTERQHPPDGQSANPAIAQATPFRCDTRVPKKNLGRRTAAGIPIGNFIGERIIGRHSATFRERSTRFRVVSSGFIDASLPFIRELGRLDLLPTPVDCPRAATRTGRSSTRDSCVQPSWGDTASECFNDFWPITTSV
jgi:hypothetical protein